MSTPLQKTVPISKNGRMNLPSDMRRAIGLSDDGYLVLTLDGAEIRVTTQAQMIKYVRDLLSPYKPENELASEQLIQERRNEAARESKELDDGHHG